MLSNKKLFLVLCLSTLSLIGTGFSSWVITLPQDSVIGISTVSEVIEINWLSSDANNATSDNGLSFIFSKNKGIKEFTKQYYDFNLIVDTELFQIDITDTNLSTAYLDCFFVISDARFYIERVEFVASSVSYIVSNTDKTRAFSKVVLIDDPNVEPNLYTFISNTISNSNIDSGASKACTIQTRVYVNVLDNITDFTNFNPSLSFTIKGGS